MNLRTRKKLLKIYTILQFIMIGIGFLSIIFITTMLIAHSDELGINMDTNFITNIIILPCAGIVLFTLYATAMTTYLAVKKRQNKKQFFIYEKHLKLISVLDIFVDGPIAILLLFSAFKKDDGKDEFPKDYKLSQKKKNKNTVKYIEKNLEQSNKEKLVKLKSDKRKGVISQEKYIKEYKKLIKQDQIDKYNK